jgi:hypothetical protein
MVAVVVAVGFVVAIREWSTAPRQPSDDAVKAEYLRISPPAGTQTERAYEVHSKHGAISVTNRHLARISAASVLGEYRKVLTQNGWRYRADFSDGRHWGEDYCKGNLLASVEIMKDQGQQAEYVFSVSWSGVSERECS